MSDWLQRYQARKQGTAPPPQQAPPQPPPTYYQQPPAYPQQQPPPAYPPSYPQPVPGAPTHAPFGYDPATGVPVAPFGYDATGRVLTQPPYQQPAQVPQQPAYQPNGLPMPQGYSQPPYGQVQPPPAMSPQQVTYLGEDGQVHVDWAEAPKAWQGGQGTRESSQCTQCGGDVIPTDAPNVDGMPGASVGVFNAQTGTTVYPAPHCSRCGAIQKSDGSAYAPGSATGALTTGIGIKTVGPARPAPGGGSEQQVASQHGLPNLFAPR